MSGYRRTVKRYHGGKENYRIVDAAIMDHRVATIESRNNPRRGIKLDYAAKIK